jgi:hypothetical protein
MEKGDAMSGTEKNESVGFVAAASLGVLAAILSACGGDATNTPASAAYPDGGTPVNATDGSAGPPALLPDGSVATPPLPPDGSVATPPGASSSAAQLAKRLGRDNFMIGLGPSESRFPTSSKIDIKYTYLVGAKNPANAWPKYNSPDGQYATLRANEAKAKGAVPMFSLYELAALGDGNFSIVQNGDYMKVFWADVKLLADRLKAFDAPAMVHVEADFWGYAQRNSPGGDPKKFAAKVKIEASCADLPDDLTGVGRCITRTLHTAPKVVVGLHASMFGAYDAAGKPDGKAVGAFLRALTSGEADFVATDASDRDAGCFEAKPAQFDCGRGGTTGWYWDEANKASPNFREYEAWMSAMHAGAQVPVLVWQVPMGVPSATPGGAPNQYRDNRVKYFFAHPGELVTAGAFGIAFGAGAKGQTTIDTDSGQFETALAAYNSNPTRLQ